VTTDDTIAGRVLALNRAVSLESDTIATPGCTTTGHDADADTDTDPEHHQPGTDTYADSIRTPACHTGARSHICRYGLPGDRLSSARG
jgi:hypothetical protein